MTKRVGPSKIMKGIKFYMVEDLAKILQVSPWSVRRYLRQGRMPSIMLGQRLWVSEKDLSDFLMCKGIRDLPNDQFIKMINKAVEIRYKTWIDEAVPLIQKTVKAFLLEQKIKSDLKKVDKKDEQLKKVLSKEAMEHLQDRTGKIKEELAKVK